jgi:hypothetical protein
VIVRISKSLDCICVRRSRTRQGVILGGLLLAFGIVDSPAAAVTMEVGTFSEGNRSTDGLKDIATPERPMN